MAVAPKIARKFPQFSYLSGAGIFASLSRDNAERKFHSGHFGRVCCLFKQINCLLNRRAAFKPPNRVASNYWLISCVCYNYASSSAIRGSSSLKQLIKSQSIIWRDATTSFVFIFFHLKSLFSVITCSVEARSFTCFPKEELQSQTNKAEF